MSVKRYRKKPVEVEAIRWTGDNADEVRDFFMFGPCPAQLVGDTIEIRTLEGVMVALVGDWIISGVKQEKYPCKPDIFEATYEPVT